MNILGFIVIFSVVQICHASCYQYYYSYHNVCSGWYRRRCRTHSTRRVRCCSMYRGSKCNIPKCRLDYEGGGKYKTSPCDILNEGRVIHKNGSIVTNSGGICITPGNCTNCNIGYYSTTAGKGYCKACPSIENCNIPHCTKPEDVTCEYCVGEYIADKKGYNVYTGFPDRKKCQESCSWRDGARCFPGSCGENHILHGINESCTCADGFEGKNCAFATVNNTPTILEMEMTLKRLNVPSLKVDTLDSSHDAVFWTKESLWSNIKLVLKSTYKPILNGARPNYITNYSIGLEYMITTATLHRGERNATWNVHQDCKKYMELCSTSLEMPLTSVTEWTPILDGIFEHMDRVTISMNTKIGGIIRYENREGFNQSEYKIETYTLHSTELTETRHLVFDVYPPTHCHEQNYTCLQDALEVQDFIKQANVTAYWSGWEDSVSGISSYTCHVYHLQMLNSSSGQGELTKGKMVTPEKIVDDTQLSVSLRLEEPGPYAVELIVRDNAGNTNQARRIIMFDNASVVEQIGDLPKIVQAGQSGWISLSCSSIELQWIGRYRNVRHSNNGWLNAVAVESAISRDLDDMSGRSLRTTDRINNIRGIVRIEIARHDMIDGHYESGEFKVVPLDYFNEQHIIYPIGADDLVDGKKFMYSIRAIDVVDEFAEDNVTVMVDLSPPVIENIWLSNGEFVNISVHNVKELSELTIEFLTYDQHSGIDAIYWSIFDNYTNTVVIHGNSGLSAQGETATVEECEVKYGSYARGPNCYCSPYNGCYHQHHQIKPTITTTGDDGLHFGNHIGEHEFDYFIQVTVINNAGLNTTKHKKITIDVSPPTEGTVYDGIPGEPEVDFQQSLQLTAYWDGFFDKESDVWFYTYGIHETCLNESTLEVRTIESTDIQVYQTYSTTAHFTVLGQGRYYITVMAYNHALDYSKAVCSDGVTVNVLPAVVTEVVVNGAVTFQGLLKDSTTGEVYMLYKNREIESVRNPFTACVEKSLPVPPEAIDLLPRRRTLNGSISYMTLDSKCNLLQRLPSNFFSWLTNDFSIDLSWNVSDIDQVHDFEVGIASEKNEFPDIFHFTTSRQHQHIRIYHPEIFNGELFFILIKSITKAMVTDIKIIGPILYDSSKPIFAGQIVLSTEESLLETFLIARWDSDAVSDESGPASLTFETAIGTKKNVQGILSFSEITSGGSCTKRYPPNCSAFPSSMLPWHLHSEQHYVVTLKITNGAGLFVTESSNEYQHNIALPSSGVVHDIEVKPSSTVIFDFDDIDYQTENTSLKCRWTGFHHPHEDITYTVCLTDNKQENYLLCEKSNGGDHHVFFNLQQYVTYYQVVIAKTGAGNVSAISDGLTIVKDGDAFYGISIYDGPNCNNSLKNVSEINLQTSHHDENKVTACHEDIDYQPSTSVLTSHWSIFEDKMSYFNKIYMSVEEKAPVVDFWSVYLDYQRLDTISFQAEIPNLFLTPGRCYRTNIKLCASKYCYRPVYSDGVCVTSFPPSTGNIKVEYLENIQEINAVFDKFYDPDMAEIKQARKVMDHYEWAIGEDSQAGRLVYKWTRIQPTHMHIINDEITSTIKLDQTLPSDKCWRLFVRGYTQAGLSSIVSDEIRNCSDVYKVAPSVVIDAIGHLVSPDNRHTGSTIFLQKNDIWDYNDVDYTPYKNILSGVWPTLRHGDYNWAVLHIQNGDSAVLNDRKDLLNLTDPCSHPDAIKCGVTDKEFINVEFDDDELSHARRFIICIHAKKTVLHHELWDQDLYEVSACSDGVTVDLTPPVPGEVWIGNNKDHLFQTSTSEIIVNWNSFIDVEEGGNAVHTSGIAKYELAIGSSAGETDVVTYTNVGLTNHKLFHNLRLQSGHTYFATVKGYDFTGQSSMSTSKAIKVDSSPPEVTESSINLNGRHITDKHYVEACWNSMFYDDESGLAHYSWAVGSNPGTDDVIAFVDTIDTCGRTNIENEFELMEGHAYFISVKAYNKAGLYSSISSWAFVVDESPPLPGNVYDGPLVDGVYNDMDYFDNSMGLQAHWKGFVEQHSTLAEYFVQVGSCYTCSDVITKQSVGFNNEIEMKHVRLLEGRRYYVTITACNTADLCSSATSDGFVVDSSLPIRGVVIDGKTSSDVIYQASINSLACKWYGFIDPQSGISHYTWRVGTARGGDNVLLTRNVMKHEEGFVLDYLSEYGHYLPVGVKMFCTIRAYNNAGKYSESASNGFIIDNSAPEFTKNLSQSSVGSIVPGTSVLRTVIKVNWDVQDNESFIETQHLSISSHIGGDFNMSSRKIGGVARDYTFTALDLHDGSFYDVHIISCNGAKICAQSLLTILVDSTPPSMGTFAINTDHAADLDRQPLDWMKWTSVSIKLAWLGFEDVHTGIESYIVNIGSSYMGSDLNEIPNQPFVIKHQFNESADDSDNYGKVQTFKFRTQKLRTDTSIFISVSAYNKVGLRSGIMHAQFELVFGGFMALVRRCNTHTCLGHCVCAPHNQLCEFEDNLCNDVSGDENPNTLIEVEDFLDLTFPDTSSEVSFSPVNTMLAAKWRMIKDQGAEPLWFEWSIGLAKYDSPMGIFDSVKDRVWHDGGQLKLNVFTISRGKPNFQELETYSYFVRVWYDDNTFAVFKSSGIQISNTPPQTISIRGKSIKEILYGASKDVDFITRQSNVFADWSGKFNGVSAYRLYLSTTPTGHDFYTHGQDINLDVTSFNISGLLYEENTKYFTIIQAFNPAGLHTTEVSDGFKLDLDPPTPGVVMDGSATTDKLASSDVHTMSSFWHSFADSGSGIVAYEYCISSNTISGSETCDIKYMTSVGIGTHTEYKPQLPFKQGQILKGNVRALDAVGHVSNIVYSDGIIIDATAPVRVKQDKCDDNVVHDSSFEDLSLMHSGEVCSLANSSYWKSSPGSCITAVNSTHAYHGLIKIHLQGSIYQNTDTTEGRYRLTFQTSIIPSNNLHTKSTAEGYISVNNDTQIFLLYQKPRTNVYAWQKHTFHFNIMSDRTKLLIGTMDNRQIAIDSVTFELCTASDDETAQPDSHVKAHTVFVHYWSSIYAEWWFVDAESPIVEYLWAIGTVKGGTQLQDFVNMGQRTHASNRKLQLLHNTEVYITVVAVNAAGLRSISYSDVVVIDLTSPKCNYVNDGNTRGDDIDYQKGLVVEVHWDITDPESGIEECQLAMGVNGKENYLQDYTHIADGQSNATVTLEHIPVGIVYSTILCTNFAGLTSKCFSDGVKIIEHPPTIDDVVLDLMTSSETQFHTRGNYHGNKSEIRFRWTGFADDDGIESYLISLQGENIPTTEIVKSSHSAYDYASFTGLDLTDGQYTVSVVAINEIKMQSQRKSKSFILFTQPPIITGIPITTSWNKQSSVASARWYGVFSSAHPMFYEVTIRMVDNGEGDLLQWQETTNTSIDTVLDENEIPAGGITVLFSVRAVGFSGLFEVVHGDLYVFL